MMAMTDGSTFRALKISQCSGAPSFQMVLEELMSEQPQSFLLASPQR
jgi:hypothetical protein